MGLPARGYTKTHPPFEPGNKVAAKSGAWSEELVAETMEELRPALVQIIERCWWITPVDRDAAEDYLRDRARLLRFERWLDEVGERDDKGEPRERWLREISALRRRCMDHRAALGLTPQARARLGIDQAHGSADLALLWSNEEGQ